MSTKLAQLSDYRKRKTKARVFEALEELHAEVLTRLEDDRYQVSPEEFEEFIVQVLADHLTGLIDSSQDQDQLNNHYRRFDAKLRKCMQVKLRSLRHFESMQRTGKL